MKTYDVIIVGGGVVGLATAAGLVKQGLQVALVDKSPLAAKTLTNGFEQRVSAISPTSQTILQNLGCWDQIQQQRYTPYQTMQIWDSMTLGQIVFSAQDIAAKQLGFIIENVVITNALLTILQQAKNFTAIANTTCEHIITDEALPAIETTAGILQAKLIIGADGAVSWLRQALAIETDTTPYQHTAIVCQVKTTLPHQQSALQRFLPAGPLAFLPLPDAHTCSIVWSADTDKANDLLALDDDGFRAACQEAIEQRFGTITEASPRIHFPLVKRHAKTYCQTGFVLVGDSAHTIHPLAGLGANLGLLDAACLVDVITRAHSKQRQIGSLDTLQRYERWRKWHNETFLSSMDLLKQVFASDQQTVQQARQWGLQFADQIQPVKRFFMQMASGWMPRVPSLAK